MLLFIAISILPIGLLLASLLVIPTLIMHRYYEKPPAIEKLENHLNWVLFYLVLAGWFILTSVGLRV